MRIGIVGCAGRMGRANIEAVLATDGVELAGGTEVVGHPSIATDIGVLVGQAPVGLTVSDDLGPVLARAHAIIDFSTPEATLANARRAAQSGCAVVVGTTGLSKAQGAELASIAAQVPIVWARNMSLGVNLLLGLVEQVARQLDDSFDIEILEMHHNRKVDAPSGTALALGEAAAKGRDAALADLADRGRDGLTGARQRGRIGFAVLRGGDVVGDHSVIFASEGERIELTHKASGRQIYARGAVRAARWAAGQPPGLYGIAEVLRPSPLP